LESIISSATRVPGLRNRVIVEAERLAQVQGDLRHAVPSDMLEAKEILKQKEAIINQSQHEARRIKEAAEQEASALTAAAREEHESSVDETEIVKGAELKAEEINQQALQESQQIVQEAQRRAYAMVDEADMSANSRRKGADQYARESLFNLEESLAGQLGEVRRGIDALGIEVETNGVSS
jgi:hypothetical protein